MAPLPRSRPVVVGIDDSDGSRAALAFATEEVRQRNAPLRLLHALSWPLSGTPAVVSPAAGPRTVLGAGAPMVVGHRHRRPVARLGSTTHGVLHRAGCPVAVVPVATDAHRGG